MTAASTIQLSEDTTIRNHFDKRSCLTKTIDAIIAVYNEFLISMSNIYYYLFQGAHQLSDRDVTWKENSDGLCVMVHGLFADPSCWDNHVLELKRKESGNIDLLIPKVVKGGNCSLRASADPILAHLKDYAAQHPQKPIYLMGYSNGGRIVVDLEEKMRDIAPSTPIKVSVIAGIPFGRDLDLLRVIHIDKWFLSKDWVEEADFRSQTSKTLLACAKEESVAKRVYQFTAASADIFVPNLACSLPPLKLAKNYKLHHQVGHFSIVKATASDEAQSVIDWIKKT